MRRMNMSFPGKMSRFFRSRSITSCFIAFISILLQFPTGLMAVDYVLVTAGDWSAPTNWSPTGVPGIDDTVLIDLAPGTPYTVTLDMTTGDTFLDALTISSSDASLYLDGINLTMDAASGLTITAGAIELSATATLTLRNTAMMNVGDHLSTANGGQLVIKSGVLGTGMTLPSPLDASIPGNSNAYVNGHLTNHTSVDFLGGASVYATLYLQSDTVLDGAGTLNFVTGDRNRIWGSAGRHFTNVSNTIQGSGNIGVNTLQLTNSGLIDCNLNEGFDLIVDPADGTPMINTGILQASNGGRLDLNAGTYQSGAGTIQALDLSTVTLKSGVDLTGGILDTQGTGVVQAQACTLRDVFNHGRLEIDAATLLDGFFITDGTLDMDGNVLTIGPDLLVGGNGSILGNTINQGTMSPGSSVGTLTIDGDFQQDSGGRLVVEVSSAGADQLVVTGDAILVGSVYLVPVNGFTPNPGSQYTIMTGNSINGNFDTLGHCDITVTYYDQEVIVTYNSSPELPDFDGNGIVDIIDMLHQMTLFGPCVDLPEDMTCDDFIDLMDVMMAVPHWRVLL